MKLYFVTDMEGVGDVRNWHYTEGKLLAEGNQLLTGEVAAALDAARACGCGHATVLEGHQTSNLQSLKDLVTEVVSTGASRYPFGLDATYDALLFIGQHAMAGEAQGHLSHTWNGATKSVAINGTSVGEFGAWALLAGTFGVPVIFLSGDDAACEEARALIPSIEAVSVKRGTSINDAVHLSHEEACARITKGVAQAIGRWRSGEIQPLRPTAPYTLEIELYSERVVKETYEFKDQQAPGIVKISPSTIRITEGDLATALFRRRELAIWKTVGPVDPGRSD